MSLNRDLKSRAALLSKGWLFLLLGIFSSALLLADHFSLQRLALLGIASWSFCRFYYFLFYVLENYAGKTQPYTGVWDAMAWAIRRKKRDSAD